MARRRLATLIMTIATVAFSELAQAQNVPLTPETLAEPGLTPEQAAREYVANQLVPARQSYIDEEIACANGHRYRLSFERVPIGGIVDADLTVDGQTISNAAYASLLSYALLANSVYFARAQCLEDGARFYVATVPKIGFRLQSPQRQQSATEAEFPYQSFQIKMRGDQLIDIQYGDLPPLTEVSPAVDRVRQYRFECPGNVDYRAEFRNDINGNSSVRVFVDEAAISEDDHRAINQRMRGLGEVELLSPTCSERRASMLIAARFAGPSPAFDARLVPMLESDLFSFEFEGARLVRIN